MKEFITRIIKNALTPSTIFVFALSLIPLLWFSGNKILIGYDNVFPLNSVAFLRDRFFSWTQVQGFGLDQSGVQGSLIIHFLDSLPQFLGFSVQSTQKILYVFWFFLLLASSYFFVLRLEKSGLVQSKFLRLFFPLLYSLNFFTLQAWWIAERTKFSLMVAAPLVFSILFPMLKEKISFAKVLQKSIICAFILSIFNGGGWAGLSLYGGLILILAAFYVFAVFIFWFSGKNDSFYTEKKYRVAFITLFFALFIGWYVLFNSYTLLPLIFSTIKEYGTFISSAGGVSGVLGWTIYLSQYTSFINLLRLQGIPDWYNNGSNHPYSAYYLNNPILIGASFFLAFVMIFAFLNIKKENRTILLFSAFILIVSLLFSAGAHRPLGVLFEFMLKTIPGFVLFRSPIFKFGYAYWFIASFLIGLSLSNLIEYLLQKVKQKYLHDLVQAYFPILIIIFIALYHFPAFSGNIFKVGSTYFESRAEIPSYVGDFSKWWEKNGANKKILLLPKLNDDWLFEQYKWHYLSLFPVLANFGNRGIVQNSDLLSTNELFLVNELYKSINERSYKKMDNYINILGIDYFLLRKDFYYNFSKQETDNPVEVEKKILGNAHVNRVASFGEWVVYKYNEESKLFSVNSTAAVSQGNSIVDAVIPLTTIENPLLVDSAALTKRSEYISDVFVIPECLSCKAEKADTQVLIPKPKIFLDSNIYNLISLREKLKKRKLRTIDERVFSLIGDGLKYAGQINGLIMQDKDEKYINIARDLYIQSIQSASQLVPEIIAHSPNPYSTAIIAQQYLDAQSDFLKDLEIKTYRESTVINLEKIVYEMEVLRAQLAQIQSKEDFTLKEVYKTSVPLSGMYSVSISRDSLGFPDNSKLSQARLFIDDSSASLSAVLESDNLNFGEVKLNEGVHNLALYLPPQENLISEGKLEKIAGNACMTYYLSGFDNIYNLEFQSKNNFDPNFYFFADTGEMFSPTFLTKFLLSGEQTKMQRVILSSEDFPTKKTPETLRIGFCAPGLTPELYRESISNLKLIMLPSPKISLHKKQNYIGNSFPQMRFQIIDPTRYKINIKGAKEPYFLVFNQRYNPNWVSDMGEHYIGNLYNNIWFIDKQGDYEINIAYKPQIFFTNGLTISFISIVFGTAVLIYISRRLQN